MAFPSYMGAAPDVAEDRRANIVSADLDARVAQSVKLAQDHLLGLQHRDGYWVGEMVVDSTLACDVILFMHWRGEVDFTKQAKLVQHILTRQLPDGGWPIYVGGPSEINASVKSYFALKLAGWTPDDPVMRRAHANILRLGGIPRLNTYSKLYLALLGQYSWKYVPYVPVEIMLLPNWFIYNIYEMSSWSRAILVPLAIINHFKPTRALPPEKHLHELFPHGTEHGDFSLPWSERLFTWRNFFLFWDSVLKRLDRLPWKPLRYRGIKEAERWLVERVSEGSDGLGAIFPGMLNTVIAFKALGYTEDNPLLQQQLRVFQGLEVDDPARGDFRIQPCLSPVWDTAITSVALAESGVASDHPALQKAADWLLAKEVRVRGDWSVKNPHPVNSGWAFEFNNAYYPDVDDTAKVLLALRLIKTKDESAKREVVDRALGWLLSFQCRDGGWAAFDKDVTQKWLEDVPFADHNAILDPPCSDITGRVIELLGKLGYTKSDPRIARAIAMLRRTQDPDGSWFGRWGVNYIYGTWQALRGLQAIGYDMNEDWVVRAKAWVESCQNEDGGWGETCGSYDDPAKKGRGESTASQTAWAIMALLACGNPMRDSVRRGIDYLTRTQRPDGSWAEELSTGTGFPRVFYMRYDMYRNNWPLLALADYRRLRAKFPA